MERTKAHGGPVKDFFIDTITKDVSLVDCILDLLDNSLDGAMRINIEHSPPSSEKPYNGFFCKISFDADKFSIEDNCGGIPLSIAIDYAFHFGRRPGAPADAKGLIGLYGIGMKRAIFKIGRNIEIATKNGADSYKVPIDVSAWQQTEDWDFDIEPWDSKIQGTSIVIKNLRPPIKDEFKLDAFANAFVRIVARDYSFFLQKGFKLMVNENNVSPFNFTLLKSDEFTPVYIKYIDDVEKDVMIEIKAGMANIPPDDDSAEEMQELRQIDYYGWFVSCNDRIVLAGDKTASTIWGDDFPHWHPQYNGFMGIINFQCADPGKLPWTTTKRNLDGSSELYRRALTKMKDVTRKYLDYTNARKADLDKAKEMEEKAIPTNLYALEQNEAIVVPTFTKRAITMTSISYRKQLDIVNKVKESLGNKDMSNRELGLETFDYYAKNELEEEI